MEYNIYCDGAASSENNVMSSGYIIYTKTTYISNGCVWMDGHNPIHSEVIAIGVACKKFLETVDNLAPSDTVKLFIDNVTAIDYVRTSIAKSRLPTRRSELRDMAITMKKLNSMCNIEFIKVHGHKSGFHPNNYVDALVKLSLRGKVCML